MQNYRLLTPTLLAVATLAACGTMSENSRLNEARNDYTAAQNNPQVVSLAPGELRQADDALAKANAAAKKSENAEVITHLAYVAKQRVAIAQETARQKAAETAITNAGIERDRLRLESRTAEAESAQRQAQTSQQQAQASQQNAAASMQQAEKSQQSAEAAQRDAQDLAKKSSALELSAEASLHAAAIAREEADIAQQQARQSELRTAQMETQLKELNAKKTERGLVITLGDVLFDTNKSDLKTGANRSLKKLADFLKKYPDRQAEIEGYTDSTGNPEHNKDLSERRANAVRASLLRMGIGPDRLTTRGFGPESPVASNDTSAGRQMNRRVEIIVSDEVADTDVSAR